MIDEELAERFLTIISESTEMVYMHVDKSHLTGNIDYASIYAHSENDYERVSYQLKRAGIVAIERPSGNYYKLHEPLITPAGIIHHCRIRKYDDEHQEKGYLDFELVHFESFKTEYINQLCFCLINEGEEMVELSDPNFDVRAYFPIGDF